MIAGDALVDGRRERESLEVQPNPHAGESARVAAMAQETEATLSTLQASPLTDFAVWALKSCEQSATSGAQQDSIATQTRCQSLMQDQLSKT